MSIILKHEFNRKAFAENFFELSGVTQLKTTTVGMTGLQAIFAVFEYK
jgi:hypothetical protein